MNGVPIQTYLFPPIMLVILGFMYFRGLKLRAQTLQDKTPGSENQYLTTERRLAAPE